jgi:hypothetical protein
LNVNFFVTTRAYASAADGADDDVGGALGAGFPIDRRVVGSFFRVSPGARASGRPVGVAPWRRTTDPVRAVAAPGTRTGTRRRVVASSSDARRKRVRREAKGEGRARDAIERA